MKNTFAELELTLTNLDLVRLLALPPNLEVAREV